MEEDQIKALLAKYNDGSCTEVEKTMVESWYNQWKPNAQLRLPENDIENAVDKVWINLQHGILLRKTVKLWPKLIAAASVLIALGFGGYFFVARQKLQKLQNYALQHDIAPGRNSAILTLANGSKLVLDHEKRGKLTQQGQTKVIAYADGKLLYDGPKGKLTDNVNTDFNLVETPRGGQYQLTLSDGTRVWLNAASSIHFPVSFKGNERRVSITGEAYFEVAHNKTKPFIVETAAQQIEVLGTHFNINSYPDEAVVNTTLLEGKIKLKLANNFEVLTPGLEAIVYPESSKINVHPADLEAAIAWKNGYFRFKNEDIGSVMRKLSRWYNIDVSYDGNRSTEKFSGSVSKFKNISQVLKMLEYSQSVHFKVEGRRLTVSK